MTLHKDDFGPAPAPPAPSRRPRSVVGPVILIAVGVIFLLVNLGWITWDIWTLLIKLWPVWLIAAGLDILFGRQTAWGRWVILGLVLAVIGGAMAYFPGWGMTGGTEVSGDKISAPVGGARRAVVEIKPGVGELKVRALSDTSLLVDGRVWRLEGSRLVRDARAQGDTLHYSLHTEMVGIPINFGGGRQGVWDLELNPEVPTDLRVGTGVGESTLDLSDLNLTDLKMDTGVGETTVTLPVRGRFRAELNTGIGATTIYIPKSLAVRIRFNTGIGASSVHGDFVKQGSYWESTGYESAEDRAEITISGGIGEIRVRQVNN